MLIFDKKEIREQITIEDVYDLLTEWGAEPQYTPLGIVSATICHNEPGVGSHKLWYYENSDLFKCYTECEENVFDIFELTRKVFSIQKKREIDLNDAIRYIAARIGISGRLEDAPVESKLIDWEILSNYDRIQSIEINISDIVLKEYNADILNRFNYNIKLTPWLNEGITQEVLDLADIGYYVGGDQITIPHFDCRGRFIGLRGRTMCVDEAERYGKYRPLKINNTLYSHPLGMNLYGLNWAKDNIQQMQKAIVFESEKACLQYMSYFGVDASIAVACCGSNLSVHQMQMLLDAGAKEVIIAFDKQYEKINTDESKRWSTKLSKIHERYGKDCQVSFIWDKKNLLDYKDSPTDKGKEVFLELFKERILL